MAKRGRKRVRKGYFYEDEEQAVIDYINETDIAVKNRIFNTYLYPALTKMIESIIRRYKLYVPDEEFAQTFNDTISYLLTKIGNFKPEILVYEKMDKELDGDCAYVYDFELENVIQDVNSGSPEFLKVECSDENGNIWYDYYQKIEKHFKAYSYCGTVCKNYLFFKNIQFCKKQERTTPYDTVSDVFENDVKYSEEEKKHVTLAESLIKSVSVEIRDMVDDASRLNLNENQIKVGNALCNLLDNWEELLREDGSNKLQKSLVLYYLREQTNMTTKEVRDNMRSYKKAYYLLKKAKIEDE